MHNKRYHGLGQIFQQCSKHPHPPTFEDDKFHDGANFALVLDCTAFLSFVDAAKSQPYLQKDINLPDDEQLEKYINHVLTEDIENQNAEIVALAKSIVEPDDLHKYLDDIIDGLGDEENVGLYKVIEELAKHPEWNAYTESVRNWLIKEKKDLGL